MIRGTPGSARAGRCRAQAAVIKGNVVFSGHMLAHGFGQDDATWLGKRLQPGRDVAPLPIEIAIIKDHVTQV
ncbi:hypothetical protein [Ensifer sp. MJa1]|uniref:hypothetical protein n=1 Tax=Ensifer sp. MJa1 TaxID=2919888 RepID=UPI00300A165C